MRPRLKDNDWLDGAACRGSAGPNSVFYNDGTDPENPNGPEDAQAICDVCPVRDQCMLEAVHYEQGAEPSRRHLVWAGFTPAQRYAAEHRKAVTCSVCGTPFDPKLVRDGIVRCPVSRRHVDRVLPPIPLEGDEWSRRHTVIARRVLKHLETTYVIPRPRPLAKEWGLREADMVRVYEALVMDGTLYRNKRGDYKRVRRAQRIDTTSWIPPHQVR